MYADKPSRICLNNLKKKKKKCNASSVDQINPKNSSNSQVSFLRKVMLNKIILLSILPVLTCTTIYITRACALHFTYLSSVTLAMQEIQLNSIQEDEENS